MDGSMEMERRIEMDATGNLGWPLLKEHRSSAN